LITVSIEDSSVKITSVRGKRVVVAVETPLQEGWVQDGVVLEKAQVGQVISAVLAQYKIREKEAVASVSGIHSIYRVVYVPKLDPALLAEAARKEMARAIPVPLASLYTSWAPVKTSDIEVALCLVGLPFDNVNSVTETLKLCGLQIKYLELKPLAVSRVIDEKIAIVINVQSNCFDLSIMNKGVPEMIRSLPFTGGAAMSETDKAVMVKEEVDRTVNFYNSGHPNSPLGQQTPCIVSGMLRETLCMVMGYPVKPAPALLAYPKGQDGNDFVANSGLALRTISKLTKVDINAMPGAEPSARPAAAGLNPAPLVALGVCAALALGMWVMSGMAEKQTADMQLLMNERNTQLSSLQKRYKDVTDQAVKARDADQQALNQLTGPIKYLAEQRGLVNRDLGQVFTVLPASMYLTSVSDDGNTVRVQGSAPSEEIMLNYARDLRNSELFKLVLISAVDTSTYTEVTFTMQLTVNQ
jgi:type IV pilus assembly protein PilM